MKSGIKYVDGMDLRGVIKAGLEDFELDYTGCKSADMILEMVEILTELQSVCVILQIKDF